MLSVVRDRNRQHLEHRVFARRLIGSGDLEAVEARVLVRDRPEKASHGRLQGDEALLA
jgi:hypothetical protein